jgi:hypothetical protein
VRVSNTVLDSTPPDRLGLDRLMIKAPLATDLIVANVTTIPPIPLYTDSVRVRAELTDYILSPTVNQVRAYYHIGADQWGTWPENQYLTLNLDMGASDTNANPPVYVYESGASIPAQAIDETVQYRIKVEYSGELLAHKTSPKVHTNPGTNPTWYEPVNYNQSLGGPGAQNLYYVVFSCPPGAVWINEFNVDQDEAPYGDREYIELCGPAGTSIANWKIALTTVGDLDGNGISISQIYKITQNTSLPSQTNDVGFWVLGDVHAEIPADQTFTNTPDGNGYHMLMEGGIQLIRSMGAVEDAISYNVVSAVDDTYATAMTNAGFVYAGANDFFFMSPVALVGTGTGRVDFAWSDNTGGGSYSPGMDNLLQTFLGNEPTGAFQLLIESLTMGSDMVLWTTYTNGVTPYVMYSTNLMQSNAWHHVTNESWEVSNESFRISFPGMTNSPATFYRVTVTN